MVWIDVQIRIPEPTKRLSTGTCANDQRETMRSGRDLLTQLRQVLGSDGTRRLERKLWFVFQKVWPGLCTQRFGEMQAFCDGILGNNILFLLYLEFKEHSCAR